MFQSSILHSKNSSYLELFLICGEGGTLFELFLLILTNVGQLLILDKTNQHFSNKKLIGLPNL